MSYIYLLLFSCFAFPLLLLSSVLPLGGSSLFDFTFLPLLSIYGLFRFRSAYFIPLIRLPIYLYIFFLSIVFFLRLFIHADTDLLVIGTYLRLILPLSLLAFFRDLYLTLVQQPSDRRASILNSLFLSYLLTMLFIMILSFINGPGPHSLGNSFPFYTDNQIDRHVYGPATASLTIFLAFVLYSGKLLRLSWYKKLGILMLFLLSLFSSFASGSRSPLVMYVVTLVPFLAYLVSVRGLKSSIKVIAPLLLVFFASFLFVSSIDQTYATLSNRFFEAAGLILHPTSDISRGGVILTIQESFANESFWLMGANNIITAADSGPLSLLLNSGLFVCIFFVAACFLATISAPRPLVSTYLVAIFVQFLVASETLFIPRYLLVATFPIFFLSCYSHLPRLSFLDLASRASYHR